MWQQFVSQLDVQWQSAESLLEQESPALVLSELSHLGILAISGQDSRTFLQGQLTSDVLALTPETAVMTGQCDAKGKLMGLSRLFLLKDTYFQIHRADQVEAVNAVLGKYAVFSKVDLTNVSNDWLLLGLSGPEAPALLQRLYNTDQTKALAQGALLRLEGQQPRFILMLDIHSAQALHDALPETTRFAAGSYWEHLEIQHGIPTLPEELVGELVPQMVNLDCLDGISFSKGCYIGQETVARMHYRGGLKRRTFLLSGQAEATVTPGMDIEVEMNGHWRRAGRVVRSYQDSGRLALLAVLPIDSEPAARYRIKEDEDSTLAMQSLPYSLTPEA